MNVLDLLSVNTPPLELVLRASLMYWFLLLMFRFVLRRDPGALGVADILFIVIVADASQNALSGNYDTVAEGVILVGTLGAWNYAMDWASYRWRPIHRLTNPPPVLLIDHGRILARNLRSQQLTHDDLEEQLRLAGVADITRVRRAYMESDGKVSVITFPEKPTSAPRNGTPGAD